MAIEFSVQIEGLAGLKLKSDKLAQNIAAEVNKALFVSAKQVEGDAKRSILDGKKSGRVYKRRTVLHHASSPGEAPASDTGRLVNSINAVSLPQELAAEIKAGNSAVKYAAMLEFGTSKMAARPFFQPALEKNRRRIVDRVMEAVRRATAKAGQ